MKKRRKIYLGRERGKRKQQGNTNIINTNREHRDRKNAMMNSGIKKEEIKRGEKRLKEARTEGRDEGGGGTSVFLFL